MRIGMIGLGNMGAGMAHNIRAARFELTVYDELVGWQESTVGVKTYQGLPKPARKYLRRIEELCAVPVDLISTGPEREETIVMRHPFDA